MKIESAPYKYRYIILALTLLLGLRLTYVFYLPNKIEHWRDGYCYNNIAHNLINGIGYWDTTGEWPGEPPYADPNAPTVRWLPGYPLFVAAVYKIAGDSPRAVYIAQALVSLAIAIFIYLCAIHIIGRRGAIVAIFLYAIDPFSIFICGRFQTEQIFTFFLIISVYFFLKPKLRYSNFFGLTAAAATLTRAVAGPTFLALCVTDLFINWQGIKDNDFLKRFLKVALALVVFSLTLAPWMIRNYVVTGDFVFSTEAWQTLSMANNDNGSIYMTYKGLKAMPKTNIQQSELERENIYKKFLVNWIKANPLHFVKLFLQRLIGFWLPTAHYDTGGKALLTFVFNISLFVLMVTYIIAYRHQWHRLLPFFAIFATFSIVYAMSLVCTRFRIPLYPFIEILAAGGVIYIFQEYQDSHASSSS